MAASTAFSVEEDPKFATKVVFGGNVRKKWDYGAVVPPIHTSKIYDTKDQNEYYYGRLKNPTRQTLEEALASLENAKHAVTFASGVSAITSIFQLLKPRSHMIAMDSAYSGTDMILRHAIEQWDLEVSFVDAAEVSNIENAIKENTKLIWIESPSNPAMELVDLAKVAEIVKQNDGIIFCVDNTFMTPYFQKPLELGADLVMHSVSKYINGHSDVIVGAVLTNQDELYKRIYFSQAYCGHVPSPFDCYLVLRGMRTLQLRMREHMRSALKIAEFLENHPLVENVFHPGLPSHPQYELGKRQCSGYCGMLSFIIKGGEAKAKSFCSKLKLFAVTASLGGYESLAFRITTIIHVGEERLPEKRRDLIRLSIGLENADDLIDDLHKALTDS